MNLKDAMRESAKTQVVPVEVDGWGTVYIAALTVAQIDELSKRENMSIAESVSRYICNEDGTRAFSLDNAEDMALIGAQPMLKINTLLKAVEKLNAISIEGVDEAKKA